MARIAVNGIGRIGKLLLRRLIDTGHGPDIVLINDRVGDAAQHAQLLEFDSVHGRWPHAPRAVGDRLILGDHGIRVTQADAIEDLPLSALGVDLVLDCTGFFKTMRRVQPYLDAGVRKVVVSAPIKEAGALNIVYGVNHQHYDPASHAVVTAASCTTNCLAPIVQVLHEEIGIKHGSITTVHDVTNTQTIVDRPAKSMRRARSALNSMIPTTTGSATAITVIFPELAGRLNGHAVRVPLLNASLTDGVFEMQRETSVEEVNGLFRTWADGRLKGILGYEERELVSADFLNDPRSGIIDAPSTMVVNGTQVKVYAWYDNEWGYCCRMADIAEMVARDL